MFDNIRRHMEVWKEAYRQDKKHNETKFKVEEADFLPAALEILEKPASPLGRTMMVVVIIFFCIALVWAVYGRVDVVATAQGRIVPEGNIKMIQPAELGVVRRILVKNGQAVKAGDSLVELDTTFSGADAQTAKRELQVAQVMKARAEVILARLAGKNVTFNAPVKLDPSVERMQTLLINASLDEYNASIDSYGQQKKEREADLAVVKQEIAKLEETLPLLEEQVAARAELLAKGLTPRFQYLERQERLVGQRRDLLIQQDQMIKVEASIIAAEKQIEQARQEYRKNTLEQQAEAEDQIVALTQELTKADQRRDLQNLKSPVDGVVQQLSIHTVGGVVQAGDPLMVVIPKGNSLIVEANILNKDIGFVFEGQKVEVKLEAFPFTKYGVIHGTLEHLAKDAVNDENLGLIYPARIVMKKTVIRVKGKDIKLGPGMAVTAEIKTGKRRIIEFILSPLLRYKDESLRER